MQNWDYAWRGKYYITICTKGRACYFGQITNGQMILSEIGEIAKREWLKSPDIRPDMNLTLDEYIIMPNHIHGIIQIGRNSFNKFDNSNDLDRGCNCSRDAMHGVSTTGTTTGSTRTTDKSKGLIPPKRNKSGPQRKNLSSIIRGFKSVVTANVRKINSDFGWQPRFHDHLIRDNKSLNNIRHYIRENPKNWAEDELNPDIKQR